MPELDIATPEPDQAEAARSAVAGRMARSTLRGDKTPEAALPTVSDADSYERVKPGSFYLDPEGNKRKRLYEVKSADDYSSVPEGEEYTDPEGNTREKPTSAPISFTSQTLFNMSTNDKERKKALEQSYPGKVKKEGNEWVIDDDGTLRKPKGMTQTAQGFGAGLASGAAPVLGAIAGEVGGGIAGSAVAPGIGTFAGAVGGGAAGGALGQGFNDAILQLAGVYDRSGAEEAGELGLAGAAGGVGTAAGRVLGGASPFIKGQLKNALPKAAANFLGADEEGLRLAIQMHDKGIDLVPPSMWAKESPHLQNIAEVLDPAFRTQKPLQQAAEKHYEKAAGDIAANLGMSPVEQALGKSAVKTSGSFLSPEAKVSSKQAGEQLLLKAREESALADQKLASAFDGLKDLQARGVAPQSQQNVLRQAEAQARAAAQKLIDAGFQDIEKDVGNALKIAKAGSNSGDLWWSVAEKMKAVRQGIQQRASKMYDEADRLAGGHLPDSADLPDKARAFLEEVPPDFKSRYPSVVQKLEALAGEVDEHGQIIKEAVIPTFGQLHNVRSLLRDGADWYTLASDVKNGSFKYFAKAVDDILHDGAAVPELKAAAESLDKADAFYAENMKVFNARNIKTVMDGLRAGEPADPTVLFNAIVKEGHSDLTRKVLDMIGPNLAAGVRAADVRTMLKNAESIIPGQVDGMKFANEVLSRVRSDMLESIHGPQMAAKLREQAQNILALEGKIDIPSRPGDTALDVIGRARDAAEAAKQASRADPLAALGRETKKLEADKQRALAAARRERTGSKLGKVLFDPTVGAVEAADRILNSEDLLLAAAAKFGDKSPEFDALRQVYAMRILQGSMDVGSQMSKIPPEIQNLMFPGATLDQMKVLAKEMEALLNTRGMAQGAGKSIMATARVEHPWGAIPLGKTAGKLVPGWDAGGRAMLGKYYKFVTDLLNKPWLLRWIEKGLKGDEAARQMTRQQLQRMMQRGGAVGAAAGESQFAAPQQPE